MFRLFNNFKTLLVFCSLLSLIAIFALPAESWAESSASVQGEAAEEEATPKPWEEEEYATLPEPRLADPFQPVNRVMFAFNDKLYLYVLKPIGQGYAAVFPQPVRIGVDNFFYNLRYPLRFVNDILQAKIIRAGKETTSFLLNTIFGFAGLLKPAQEVSWLSPAPSEEDTGQTLGTWGFGPGFYIVWPVLGPSSLRGSVGKVGDYFLDPLNYVEPYNLQIGLSAGERVNSVSLRLGEYEDLKEAALDPYIAFKDAYYQYRQKLLEE